MSKHHRWRVALGLALVLALVPAGGGDANGGTLQAGNVAAGPYTVSAYTSPSPLQPGRVDVSFLVQRAGTTEVVDGATVDVRATPLGRAGAPVTGRAGPARFRGHGRAARLPIARLAFGSLLATIALASVWWALLGRRRPARPSRTGE